jgi:hypothetical protein
LVGHLLAKRFGPLPEWAETRLAEADAGQLERWSDALLDAPDLESVFKTARL